MLVISSVAFALELSEVQWQDQRYTVVRVEPTDTVRLLGQTGRTGITLGEALELAPPGSVAVNAGMYHAGFVPVGLHVEGFVPHAPLETRALSGNFGMQPNGVFAVGPAGATVQTTQEWGALADDDPRAHPAVATQSGPMLVIDDRLHPRISASGRSVRVRNGVGVAPDGTTWLAISREPVTFHALATLFRDQLGCPDALYLDGTVSELATRPTHAGRRFSGALVVVPAAER